LGGSERPTSRAGFVVCTNPAHLSIDRVFKGLVPAELTVLDFSSYSKNPDGWFGSSGACGTFDEDPRGRFMIVALTPTQNHPGSYTAGLPRLFYIGDGPEGEAYEQALERLSPLGPPSPPAAGNTTTPPGDELPVLALSLLAISATLIALPLVRRR